MAPIFVVIAAGVLASGILFAHKRLTTFVAAAGVLAEGQWLLLTLIDRTVARGVASEIVYLIGGLVCLLVWGLFIKQWSTKKLLSEFELWRELVVVVMVVVVLAAAGLVAMRNGWQDGAWVMHGFYNGDTVTLVSLVQESLLFDGIVQANPFNGGGALEYPTLLHGGIAGLLILIGSDLNWLHLLPWMTGLQILMTVPLFFLLWDVSFPEDKEKWKMWFGIRSKKIIWMAQAAIVAYVLALSWEGYIYPQGHFFLLGMFMMLIALLVKGYGIGSNKQWLGVVVASFLGLVLMLANAVTGTAAVAAVLVLYLLRVLDKGRGKGERLIYLTGIIGWLVLYVLFAPGEGSFGWLGFSYTAAQAMAKYVPALLGLIVGIWLMGEKKMYLGAVVILLTGMAFATFLFSTRNIVVANADRFIYHALLVGYVMMLTPLVRLYYWLRQQFMFNNRAVVQQVISLIGFGALIVVSCLPALVGVTEPHDHLMFKNEQIVSAQMHQALRWIQAETKRDDIILTSPYEPWSVPMFTGRYLLRIEDYWLSPDDTVLSDVKKSFAGDRGSQQRVMDAADYLLLTREEEVLWETDTFGKQFENEDITIYKL